MGQGTLGEVLVFEPDGTFAATVGKKGQGPLEFLDPVPFHVDPTGLVYVFDWENGRVSAIGEDLSLRAEMTVPAAAHQMVGLPGRMRFAATAWVPSSREAGFPIHILEDGQIVSSVGAVPSDLAADVLEDYDVRNTFLSTDRDGNIFSVGRHRYRVEAWSHDGSRIGRITGPSLGNEWRRSVPLSDDNPPPNIMTDISVDDDGRIWLLMAERRPNWMGGMEERISASGDVSLMPKDGLVSGVYRFRLDVIDVDACTPLASQWLDFPETHGVGAFMADGNRTSIVDLTIGEIGDPFVRVWNVDLVR